VKEPPARAKVVHVVTRLDLGGAQQNTLHTVAHLDPSRFEAVLLCGEGGLLDPEARALADNGTIRLRVIPHLVRELHPLKDLVALLEIWSVLWQERPAVVHTHSSKAGILGRFAAFLAGVPVVVHTFHGFGFHERMPSLLRGVYEAVERAAAACSTRLIFVSEANRAQAARLGLGEPRAYRLIRSGVALAAFPAKIPSKEQKKASLGLRMHKPLVLGVGNFKPQKNPEDFLKAAEWILERAPETSFLYVGDGPLRAPLQARILGRGLAGKIVFPGWRRDVPELLAAADVFALSSLWEGLPRSLIEAMKSGLPCVAYAADGVRDVLKDGATGLAVEPGDWRALAESVLGLLQDAERAKALGRAAAAAIGPEFDIDEMVRAQERLYEELLSAAPAGR